MLCEGDLMNQRRSDRQKVVLKAPTGKLALRYHRSIYVQVRISRYFQFVSLLLIMIFF